MSHGSSRIILTNLMGMNLPNWNYWHFLWAPMNIIFSSERNDQIETILYHNNMSIFAILNCQSKKPYLYLEGIDMVFWKFCLWGCSCIHYIKLIGFTRCPAYHLTPWFWAPVDFKKSIRRRKNRKNHIYTNSVYICFFLEILPKNTRKGMLLHWYESNMCSLAQALSKIAKNDQKPYLYHTGIDMV